jgi:hypothetical protein
VVGSLIKRKSKQKIRPGIEVEMNSRKKGELKMIAAIKSLYVSPQWRLKLGMPLLGCLGVIGLLITVGCGSTLIVRSEPGDAKVSILQAGSRDAKAIGATPVEITDKSLQEILQIDPNSSNYYEVMIEKEGFETEKLMVPSARFVPMKTTVEVRLRPGSSEMRLASQLVQLLLNAQKFATKAEYDRAQVELDRALLIDPNFTRAMTMRGSIFFLQGRYQDSLTWYEKALALDSKLDEAVKMITQVKKKIGKDSP